MNTRQQFVIRFGEAEARRIEDVARTHREDEHGNPMFRFGVLFFGKQRDTAQDPFLLDIATVISWECLTVHREAHGFRSSESELREWIRANAVPPAEYRDPVGLMEYAEYLGEDVAI